MRLSSLVYIVIRAIAGNMACIKADADRQAGAGVGEISKTRAAHSTRRHFFIGKVLIKNFFLGSERCASSILGLFLGHRKGRGEERRLVDYYKVIYIFS
jgi:hypothetical protein